METSTSIWTRRYWIARRIIAKRLFRLWCNIYRQVGPPSRFAIKPGYCHAAKSLSFDDTLNKDEWQKDVYTLALSIVQKNGYLSVIDLGCGSAYKLIHYLGQYQVTGIEVGHTCDWLRRTYPERRWFKPEELDPSQLRTDLVICADVIEHVENPDSLIEFIVSIQSEQVLFSTPERDAIAGVQDLGPPENPSHYREWSAREFRNYLSQWFVIEEQRIFKDSSVTQVIVCKKLPI